MWPLLHKPFRRDWCMRHRRGYSEMGVVWQSYSYTRWRECNCRTGNYQESWRSVSPGDRPEVDLIIVLFFWPTADFKRGCEMNLKWLSIVILIGLLGHACATKTLWEHTNPGQRGLCLTPFDLVPGTRYLRKGLSRVDWFNSYSQSCILWLTIIN